MSVIVEVQIGNRVSGKWEKTDTLQQEAIDVLGSFAITPDVHDPKRYRVTHVPTGLSVLKEGCTLTLARRALKAAQRLPGDWAGLVNAHAMTVEMRAAGRRLRARLQPDVI